MIFRSANEQAPIKRPIDAEYGHASASLSLTVSCCYYVLLGIRTDRIRTPCSVFRTAEVQSCSKIQMLANASEATGILPYFNAQSNYHTQAVNERCDLKCISPMRSPQKTRIPAHSLHAPGPCLPSIRFCFPVIPLLATVQSFGEYPSLLPLLGLPLRRLSS